MKSAVVIHVPHASTVIPATLRDQFALNDHDLARELRIMTDHFTDVLFDVPTAMSVRFPVSRLVLDPERFESDDLEIMAAKGMGVVYTHTSEMMPLRRALSADERARLIAFYRSDARVSAIMIEVNRRLYLNEVSGTAAGFEECHARLTMILKRRCVLTLRPSPSPRRTL